MPLTRRRTLLGTTAVVAGLAGCSTGDGSTTGDDDSGDGDATATTTTTPTATDDSALDLREANVVGVEVDRRDEAYRFDVTLIHDDDGEDSYANWWQVETLSGDRLGRRDLAHAHGTREFTRSATVDVPSNTPCVVVRGHDQTHGYGGQAMLVTVETGTTEAVGQGAERRSMADREC
ncbi:MAG: hypothetical protein V5A16_04040 [Haloplanus sp.]